jgi:hypothetical protein
VLICSERKVLLADCWWLFVLREKYCWLVADKPNEQGAGPQDWINPWAIKKLTS